MCHRHIPFVAILLAALLSVAADKKPEKAKESAPSAEQIQTWVKQLGDDDFKVREEATQNLIKAGGVAFDKVAKATKSEDAEVKQRALKVLKQISKQLEKTAIAYFEKLGGRIFDVDKPGNPVIGLYLGQETTDAGLVHLKGLPNLQFLNLGHKTTDAGLVHLTGLTSLRTLYLWFTKVTDAGLVHLIRLVKLEELDLTYTKVTDAGLVHLKGLTSLQRLTLNNTKVTGVGLIHLKGLTHLRVLSLEGSKKVTDAGLGTLKGLTKLQELYLQGTRVTDAGIVHLKGLANLRVLKLNYTRVTKAGIEKLRKSLPNCKIKWDGK